MIRDRLGRFSGGVTRELAYQSRTPRQSGLHILSSPTSIQGSGTCLLLLNCSHHHIVLSDPYNMSAPSEVPSEKVVKKETLGNVQLRHHETNEIILVPTPTNDPNDPLNW